MTDQSQPTPTPPQAPPAAAPPQGGGAPNLERYGQQMESVQAADAKAYEERSAAMLKPMSALSGITSSPMPQAPQQQKLGPAPDAMEYQKHAKEFVAAMAVLGAVASRFTRMPGGAALSAFGGALNGWQQGNLQMYENAAKKWEQDSKAAIENNKQVMDKYKLALENRKMNIDEQMSQIQLISAQYHDKIMYDAAAAKNYTLVAQIYEKNFEQTYKAEAARSKLMERRDEQTQKNEQTAAYWLSPQGQQKFETLQPAQQASIKQMIEMYGKGKAAADPKTAPAMALKQFIDETVQTQGRKPTSEEIRKFQSDFSGAGAYGRTAGSQGARVESATNEVEQLLPQAIETSRALPRGKFVPVNTVIQRWQQGTSDPAYNDFALANFSLVNAYTRAMNPQGVPRVNDRLEQHAIGILSTATSPEAYEVQAKRLWKEVQASKTAVAKTAEGRTPGDINAPMPGGAPPVAAGNDGWTVKEK